MTENEALEALDHLLDSEDVEVAHRQADLVLCELLESLGHARVVKEWHRVQKWYA